VEALRGKLGKPENWCEGWFSPVLKGCEKNEKISLTKPGLGSYIGVASIWVVGLWNRVAGLQHIEPNYSWR